MCAGEDANADADRPNLVGATTVGPDTFLQNHRAHLLTLDGFDQLGNQGLLWQEVGHGRQDFGQHL